MADKSSESARERGRREESELSTRLAYLLIGGSIGALLALLLAPKSGHELRGDIADATRKGIDRTRAAATQLGTRAEELYRSKGVLSAASDAPRPTGAAIARASELGGDEYKEGY